MADDTPSAAPAIAGAAVATENASPAAPDRQARIDMLIAFAQAALTNRQSLDLESARQQLAAQGIELDDATIGMMIGMIDGAIQSSQTLITETNLRQELEKFIPETPQAAVAVAGAGNETGVAGAATVAAATPQGAVDLKAAGTLGETGGAGAVSADIKAQEGEASVKAAEAVGPGGSASASTATEQTPAGTATVTSATAESSVTVPSEHHNKNWLERTQDKLSGAIKTLAP